MKNCEVLVLLATYNGEKFVREMIDSVINQDADSFHIILSDDASSDSTVGILDEYAEKYPELITHYRSGKKFGNAQNHFMHLLSQFHDAPYIMFCDQDDYWHSDKIRKTLAKMKEIETEGVPALVHTDLVVVDGDLKKIADSFCGYQKLDGNRLKLNQLLVQNVVTGCTMMINNSLADLSCRCALPKAALMHDWWIAIICSVFGTSAFLDCSTIDYRQHGNNSVGAKNVTSPSYLLAKLKSGAMKKSLRGAAGQAEAFLECYGDIIPQDKKEVVAAFAETKDASLLRRSGIYIKHHLFKYGITRLLAQFLGG